MYGSSTDIQGSQTIYYASHWQNFTVSPVGSAPPVARMCACPSLEATPTAWNVQVHTMLLVCWTLRSSQMFTDLKPKWHQFFSVWPLLHSTLCCLIPLHHLLLLLHHHHRLNHLLKTRISAPDPEHKQFYPPALQCEWPCRWANPAKKQPTEVQALSASLPPPSPPHLTHLASRRSNRTANCPSAEHKKACPVLCCCNSCIVAGSSWQWMLNAVKACWAELLYVQE